MPTQTGTLKAGNQLVIDSIGSPVDYDVSVTGYAVDFRRIQQKNTLSLGPYKVDCSYSVTTNSGSPSIYKVQPNGQREYTAATLPDPATLAPVVPVSVNGRQVVSDGIKFNPISISNDNSIAVFGTSIENFTLSADGTSSLANGGVNIANSMMGLPWKTVYDFGVDGDKSTGFVTRMQPVLDVNPGWVWVGFPINDVIFDDVPVETTLANMQLVYETFRLYGCTLILNLGQPISAFSTDTSGAKKKRYFQIRAFVEKYAASHNNVYLLDTAYAFTDINPNGGFNIGSPAVTSDGIHDNYVGAFKKALLIKDAVSAAIKARQYRNTNPQSYWQHLTNTMLIGDNAAGNNGYSAGAGITGTGANLTQVTQIGTGTTVGSRSATARPYTSPTGYSQKYALTTVAAQDGVKISQGSYANVLDFVKVWASGSMGIGFRRIPTLANGYYYTCIVSGTTSATEPVWPTVEGATIVDGGVKWLCRRIPVTGEKWFAEIEYSITTTTNGAAIQCMLEAVDTSGVTQQTVTGNKVDTALGWSYPTQPRDGVIRTPIMTIGAYNVKNLTPSVVVVGDTAGGTVTFEIHRMNMIRVDD